MKHTFEYKEIDGKTYVKAPPNATRTVIGLSRLGYEFQEALADLIDNSIAARATEVDILVEQKIGGKIYVHVLDNGHGIEREQLPAAIQYGAEDREDDSSLGVYGFGLKTACQSFTSTFLVISKSQPETTSSMIVFDESVISREDDFLFEVASPPAKFSATLEKFASAGHGTLVIAENADRFFTTEAMSQDEKKAQKFVNKRVEVVRDHLRKVFQRFLDFSDTRAPNVKIMVNSQSLIPWDPFCLDEGVTVEAEEIYPGLRTRKEKSGDVILRGYILPSKDEFSTPERYEEAQVGPGTHGVYVYRENRLIEAATYFKLFKRETHLSNLRVEFSYDGALDELFFTGLQKESMALGDLEDKVRDFLRPLMREADQRSRGVLRQKDTKDFHTLSQKKISAAEPRVPHAEVTAIDAKTALVKSKYGPVVLPIPSLVDDVAAVPINPVASIDDGQLWQMRLHNGRQVLELNKGHDFYSKVYLPNRGNPLAIQGLDMVFWALAITEANCTIPEYQKQFREFRYEVSRTLREVVESLPEPKIDGDDDWE